VDRTEVILAYFVRGSLARPRVGRTEVILAYFVRGSLCPPMRGQNSLSTSLSFSPYHSTRNPVTITFQPHTV